MTPTALPPPTFAVPAPSSRPRASGWAALFVPLAAAFVASGSMVMATAIKHGALWYPGCLWKRLTTLPCPGCGGTRCLAALGSGEWSAAFLLNPLAAIAVALAWAAVPMTLFDLALNRGRLIANLRATRARVWTCLALVAFGANWIWLLIEGR